MLKANVALLAALLFALPAAGSDKLTGQTTLKDFQPAGTTDKKHKHQQFDFTFVVAGTEYTCRTPEKTRLKAVDFPVGSVITYEVNKDKGKVTGQSGKESSCTMMRVEKLPDSSPQ
jgi:gentisate 1,2-dioxygenase